MKFQFIHSILLALATSNTYAQKIPEIRENWPQTPITQSSSPAGSVFKKNAHSIVVIEATDKSGKLQGSGVAFWNGGKWIEATKSFVDSSTWIVTNAHVVKDAQVVLVIADGIPSNAMVRYRDPELDIAILETEELVIKPVVRSDSNYIVQIGDPVYAIGAPKGLPRSITEGIVSAIRISSEAKLIQITAAISPGSSGGGLFDKNGKFRGITTFKISGGESLNFAIDASRLPYDFFDAILYAEYFQIFLDEKDKKLLGDNFIKWLTITKNSKNERLLDEIKLVLDSRAKTTDQVNEWGRQIVDDYLKTLTTKISSGSERSRNNEEIGHTPVIRLVCNLTGRSGNKITETFEIDFIKNTVNGIRSEFTSNYINHSSTNDGGITIYSHEFDRTASTLKISTQKIPGLFNGSCAKVEKRAF